MHAPTPRILQIDILRGFALLGILLAHFIYWHTGGPLPQQIYEKNYGVGSSIASAIHGLLIFGKFFAFFAFLFGVSFQLQMESLEKQGINPAPRFARRLFILLIIGLIHHAFWMGDILSIYATLGFSLLLFRKAATKSLLLWGIMLALALPNKLWDAVNFLLIHITPSDPFGDIGERYMHVVQSGSIWDILRFNLDQLYGKFRFQLLGGRASITIGFFLLGMWASRNQIFDGTATSRLLLGKMLKRSAMVMGIMLLIGLALIGANELFSLNWQQNPVVGFFFGILFDCFNAGVVLVMVSGIALLLYRPSIGSIFLPLHFIGKLALTSYLLQTFFGLLLFYHIGFGLFLKTSPGWNYILALGIFSIQVLIARYWLRYFHYGPVEWLWRSATIGKWQKFYKGKQEPVKELLST